MNKTSSRGTTMAALLLAALSFALISSAAAAAGQSKAAAGRSAQFTQSYTWYDGNQERKVWLNPGLVAEFSPSAQGEKSVKSAYASARVYATKHRQAGIRFWQGVDNATGAAPRNIRANDPQGKYSAVFHDDSSSGSRMRALPGNIIVYFDPKWDEKTINSWLQTRNLQVVKKLASGPNAYVIKTGPGLEALETANTLYKSGEVKAAFPDWWQEVTTR